MSTTATACDLAQDRRVSWLWPAALLVVAAGWLLVPEPWGALLAAAGFAGAGGLCVANALQCRRTHCAMTGPLYLVAAVLFAARPLGLAIPAGLIIAGAVAGTVLAFVPEWLGTRYLDAGDGGPTLAATGTLPWTGLYPQRRSKGPCGRSATERTWQAGRGRREMQSCCTSGATIAPAICPSCGRAGRTVSRVTVGALARLEVDAVLLASTDYRFCETPTCPVVYYTPASIRLDRRDVRAAVHQKDDGPEVPLCYCFGYTRASLAREGDAGVAFVSAEVKARRCACDLKNPSGRCCLGDLRRFLRHRDSKAAAGTIQRAPTQWAEQRGTIRTG